MKTRKKKSFFERFCSKYIQDNNGCWKWIGALNEGGYGRFLLNGKNTHAHRISWEIHNANQVPDGMCVCHSCDNPSCVNPAHLWIGTVKDNNADKVKKGRCNARHGTNHPKNKLTETEILQIRESEEKDAYLAKKYNVSRVNIFNVKTRKIWRHI